MGFVTQKTTSRGGPSHARWCRMATWSLMRPRASRSGAPWPA